MVVEYRTIFDFIQFWLGAKAQPTHFSELTVVGHVYRVLINYFYRRVIMHEKMRISKGRDRADVKSDSKKFFVTQQLRSYISWKSLLGFFKVF